MGAKVRNFKIFDNKETDTQLLIFASNFALNILSHSESWFMDGIFKCSTNNFK